MSVVIAGCGAARVPEGAFAGSTLHGTVHGGQQPVSGASVRLYAAGTTGYGTGATSLLTAPVVTDANGNFSVTGDYTCPSASSQLYLVASGGNPGLAAATNNAALAMMAALGPCSLHGGQYTLDPNSFISINEVTTVASVYALAGFMSAAGEVGTSSTNAVGLANSFQTVNNLANITTGAAQVTTPAGNGTAPQAEIDTLADVLASCVNSDGTGSPCTSLFSSATPPGGTAPTNTVQAVLSIATHPGSNVAALYAMAAPTAPFQPMLASPPNDWTVAMQYTGGQATTGDFYASNSLAIDGDGSVWLLSSPFQQTPNILKYSNNGTLLSGPGGYTGGGLGGSTGLAIDPAGNAWVTGRTNANVVKLSSSGTILSGANGFTGGGLNAPVAIAIDGNGNAWVSDQVSRSVIKLDSSGAVLSGASGYSLGTTLAGIGIDREGDAWVSALRGPIYELDSSGGLISPGSGYTTTGVAPLRVGFDFAGNVWTTGDAQDTVAAKLSPSGTALSSDGGYATCSPPYSPMSAGRSCYWSYGQQFALDGAGKMWVTSDYIVSTGGRSSTITYHYAIAELSNTGTILSGTLGYTGGSVFDNGGIGVDASGNVWVISTGAPSVLLEFVGLGTPVVTPFSVGVKNGTLGARP